MEFIFTRRGKRLGRLVANRLFDLDGRLVGQLNGNHVYNVAGRYIGELEGGLILDKKIAPCEAILPCRQVSIGGCNPGSRAKSESRHADVSVRLFGSKGREFAREVPPVSPLTAG